MVQIHSPRLVVTTTWLSGVRSAATAVVQILAPTRSDRDLSFRYQVPLPLPLPLLTPCPWSPSTSRERGPMHPRGPYHRPNEPSPPQHPPLDVIGLSFAATQQMLDTQSN